MFIEILFKMLNKGGVSKGVYSFTLSTVHISSIPYITTCCPGEFQEKLSSLIPKKLQHIQLSDTTGTSNVTSFYGQMKLKKSFLAANQPDEFSTNRDFTMAVPVL